MELNEIIQKVENICRDAAGIRYDIQRLTTAEKNTALIKCADALKERAEYILAENRKDVEKARMEGMREVMIDRLSLTEQRIGQMAEGLYQVAELPDPLSEVLESFERPNGLRIDKVRVPLGVVGIIYESRPNVTADAFALTFKSGNVAVLKGGSDALLSNIAVTTVLRETLQRQGISPDAVSLIDIPDRRAAREFMKMRQYVDILIPRGSAGLIRSVVENSSIPVIETGSGNCHIYVDKDADFSVAIPVILNAKTQRVSVCNAAESLVVHREIAKSFLPLLSEAVKEKVLLRADPAALALLPGAEAASEEDFGKEYLDYILSVKTVDSTEEAIRHINHYHTGHSDCIITRNPKTAEQFTREVDSACVYVNASTRFTDGFEFGFGAEIGISTQKLHARGPMGLRELTSYKYVIHGNGQIRG